MSPVNLTRITCSGRPRRATVMGILNVTPDSFSDGGQFASQDEAIARGIELAAQGADIIDVGGESTRPGASRVDAETELERVGAVVAGLANQGIQVSVDTTRAAVAHAAVTAGAVLINDVSGGLADPDMLTTVASLGVPIVVMHWRAPSDRMDSLTDYHDVVAQVCDHLAERRDACLAAGIGPEAIVLDPGLGFSKRPEHNWQLLAHLDVLVELGQPVLVGASRKRFLGNMLDDARSVNSESRELMTSGQTAQAGRFVDRDNATAAISAMASAAGVWGVRVHDVPGTRDAILVAHAWQGGR